MSVTEHLVPPPPSQIGLLEFLRVASLSVHFPFMGVVLGCAILSVIFAVVGRGEKEGVYFLSAAELAKPAAWRKSASLFLGILPMITVGLINLQLLYDSGWTVLRFQSFSIPLVLLGFVFLHFYKSSFVGEKSGSIRHVFLGSAGTFLLLAGYLLFLAVQFRLGDPEKWPFIENAYELVWSWNVLIRLKMFMALSLALAGIGIVFFRFKRLKRGGTGEEVHARFIVYFGAGLALFFSLVIPVLWTLDIVTSPEIFLSLKAFLVTEIAVLLLLFTAVSACRIIRHARTSLSIPAFLSIVLVFMLEAMFNQFSIENANREHLARLEAGTEEARTREVRPTGKEGTAKSETLAKGKEVFEDICVLCHGFEEELVGPPLVKVIPRYYGGVEELKSFIRNPVKKDPDYPEMPEPGLEEDEIDAVVEYLLIEVKRMQSGSNK